jgi:alanyl-tRNA synthetase
MKHSEIRRTFLTFFAEREHTIVPSSSLIPKDDPTLLFTNAGMVQFKPLFAGSVALPYRRATSIQKCLRGSDLPEVGRSIKHLTFFEMLGNFSFGDYFKREGILWAWEYLTEVVKLDKDLLLVSVYEEDPEAYQIWQKDVGLPDRRIFKLGAQDNFWGPAGGLGACGPCSEIYFDLGPEFGCGKATCAPGCDCPRFAEIYNVVFPQFDQQTDGTRLPLKNRGIDTGLGMERLAMVSQQARSIFETDLFAPLVKVLSAILDLPLDDKTRPFFYAATDHARALTFAICDGVIPSSEARGYVLRSILRRALLFAERRDIHEPFLYRLSGEVVELMRQWYPELAAKREQVALIVKSEEERFLSTLEAGMTRWQELADRFRASGAVPGDEAFKLHDTFGFHIELTKELAAESGMQVDLASFEAAMQEQRERSRKETFISIKSEVAIGMSATSEVQAFDYKFCGYDSDETDTEIVALKRSPDGDLEVLLKETPFYAEAGGQIGDTGTIRGDDFELEVLHTYYAGKLRWSRARLIFGEPRARANVRAVVDTRRRREIERAHTATHLLHAALRSTLGDYVKQEGSLVEPGRLRFDFAAYQPPTPEQIIRVEQQVYEKVIEDVPVEKLRDVPIEEARKLGALAFFGENYGEKVNVIRIGAFSTEFCGGTHLRRTGEIGMMKIVSEAGIAAGIRRIEALVGEKAFAEVIGYRRVLDELGATLNVTENVLPQKVADLTRTQKILESRVARLSAQLANALAGEVLTQAESIGAIKVIAASYDFFELADLRLLADVLRQAQKENLVGLLIASGAPQIRFLVFTTDDIKNQLPAGRLAKEVGAALGGGGGGRPELAEGGGKKEHVPQGIATFRRLVLEFLTEK